MSKQVYWLAVLICVLPTFSSCASPSDQPILGEWTGTYERGRHGSFVFLEDGSGRFKDIESREVVAMTWHMDDRQTPHHLDILLTRVSGETRVIKGIVRFVSETVMQIRMSGDAGSRPDGFLESDDWNQITLTKQRDAIETSRFGNRTDSSGATGAAVTLQQAFGDALEGVDGALMHPQYDADLQHLGATLNSRLSGTTVQVNMVVLQEVQTGFTGDEVRPFEIKVILAFEPNLSFWEQTDPGLTACTELLWENGDDIAIGAVGNVPIAFEAKGIHWIVSVEPLSYTWRTSDRALMTRLAALDVYDVVSVAARIQNVNFTIPRLSIQGGCARYMAVEFGRIDIIDWYPVVTAMPKDIERIYGYFRLRGW